MILELLRLASSVAEQVEKAAHLVKQGPKFVRKARVEIFEAKEQVI